jgi:hypothetical protein
MTAKGTALPAAHPETDPPLGIFTPEMITAIREAIEKINQEGGYGELMIIFQKGQVRFIRHTVGQEFSLPRRPLESA